MPTITYVGPNARQRNSVARHDDFIRNRPQEFSPEWIEEHSVHFTGSHWIIEGHFVSDSVVETVDEGNDGTPDSEWNRNDIKSWLNDNNVDIPKGYNTKIKLLYLVKQHLEKEESSEEGETE